MPPESAMMAGLTARMYACNRYMARVSESATLAEAGARAGVSSLPLGTERHKRSSRECGVPPSHIAISASLRRQGVRVVALPGRRFRPCWRARVRKVVSPATTSVPRVVL